MKTNRIKKTHRSTELVVLAACAGVVAGVLFQCRRKQTYRVPLLRTHTSQLKHTAFVSHLHAKMVRGRNLIYCGTFQLAWNALMKLVGGTVRIEPAMEMVHWLNRKGFTAKDVDPQAVTVAVKQDVDKKRIRIKTTLEKNLKFADPFRRMKEPVYWKLGQERIPLLAFGLERKDRSARARQAKQVSVYHYGGYQEYVVGLKTRSAKDLLVLARVSPGTTLMETYRKADAWVRKAGAGAANPAAEDGLSVPFFNFHLEHDYKQLIRKVIANEKLNGWFFERAHQSVRLKLDEKGALLYSESNVTVACSRPPSPSRILAFNAPFLLYMRQKDSDSPYLVIWVGHPEILVRQKESKETK